MKYKARHDQHITEKSFKVGDIVWLQLNKERPHGLGKKIKALRYGPFEILEKVGDNSYHLVETSKFIATTWGMTTQSGP